MFKPLRANRVFKDVADQIKKAIYEGKLKPGDKLPSERELVGKFKASRVCIREALRSLELAGLLAIRRGARGGAYITDVDHRPVSDSLTTMLRLGKISIDDITEVRSIIEPKIARLAAERANSEDLDKIRKTILDMEQAVKTKTVPEGFNLEFHRAIAQAAKNPVLTLIMNSFIDPLANTISYLHPDLNTLKNVLKFHNLVFKAIERRDGKRAAKAMAAHIMDVQGLLGKRAIASKSIQRNGGGIKAK